MSVKNFSNLLNRVKTHYSVIYDFRAFANFAVAIASILFLTPFAINNFFQNRFILGYGSTLIVLLCGYIAYRIIKGTFNTLIPLITIVPSVIAFILLAVSKIGIIGILWSYPAIISFYFMLTEKKAWFANVVLLGSMLPLSWMIFPPNLASRVTATTLVVSIFAAVYIRIIINQQNLLKEMAIIDPLTGLYNRAILEITLEQTVAQFQRSHEPATILALDIDYFKKVNDTKGHDGGDFVLQKVGSCLKEFTRKADRAFRLGGEEFIIVLYDTNQKDAWTTAEKIRKNIEQTSFFPDLPITVSIGVSALKKGDSWNSWLKRGDENLYRAKEKGRNCVIA